MTDPVIIRNVAPGDIPYLFSTYLRELRDADAGALPDDLWFAAHRSHLERVLGDPKVTTLVAAASDAPNEILGYVVAEPNEVLWFVHVRKALRGQGLAKRLLTEAQALSAPLAWRTSSSRTRLRNPCRSRTIRRRP